MAFDFRTQQAYLRDKFLDFSDANVSIASSPMLYGLAIYTVFSACWDQSEKRHIMFRLDDHYKRLADSAKVMDFQALKSVISYEKFVDLSGGLLQRNNLKEDALIRASLFIDEEVAGTRTYGLKTSFSAYVYPMGEILPSSGANLCVSSWQRTADNAIPSRAKINGSYVNASLMKNEALRNGFDDALALDSNGHIAEGTVANLFIVRHGKLITPHTSTDLLEGITRNTVLTLASDLGLNCQERDIDRSELYIADEAFLCGSSARLTPVLSIDHRLIGNGEIGPLTAQLLTKYYAITHGIDNSHLEWLFPVK